MLADGVLGERRPKAWPAGAGIKFGRGGEQGRAAAHASVRSARLLVPIGTGESAFGAVLARHVILLRREQLLPLGIRLDDFCRLAGRIHGRPRRDGSAHHLGSCGQYTIGILSRQSICHGCASPVPSSRPDTNGRGDLIFPAQKITAMAKDYWTRNGISSCFRQTARVKV